MNRTEEVQAIAAHVESHGVYHCTMGEMYYDDGGPSYRERVANSAKNGVRSAAKKKPRLHKICEVCGEEYTVSASQTERKYCGRECSGIGAGAKRNGHADIKCTHCGEMHSRRRCKIGTGPMFCSQTCANRYRVGRKRPDMRGVETVFGGVTYPSLSAAGRAHGVGRAKMVAMMAGEA